MISGGDNRQKAKVCTFANDFGIYEPVQDCIANPITASQAEICQSIVNNVPISDATFIVLTSTDLNLCSGITLRAYSNTFFGAAGYTGHVYSLSIIVGVGGMMEWGEKFRIASNWAIWALQV